MPILPEASNQNSGKTSFMPDHQLIIFSRFPFHLLNKISIIFFRNTFIQIQFNPKPSQSQLTPIRPVLIYNPIIKHVLFFHSYYHKLSANRFYSVQQNASSSFILISLTIPNLLKHTYTSILKFIYNEHHQFIFTEFFDLV